MCVVNLVIIYLRFWLSLGQYKRKCVTIQILQRGWLAEIVNYNNFNVNIRCTRYLWENQNMWKQTRAQTVIGYCGLEVTRFTNNELENVIYMFAVLYSHTHTQKGLVCTRVFWFETKCQNHPRLHWPSQDPSISVSHYTLWTLFVHGYKSTLLNLSMYRIHVCNEDYLSVLFLCALETSVKSGRLIRPERELIHIKRQKVIERQRRQRVVQSSDNDLITLVVSVWINCTTIL